MSNTFQLEGNPRADGRIRFTCDDLPGFRLLLDVRDSESAYYGDIREALMMFVPLYTAAEARHKRIGIQGTEGAKDGTSGQVKLVASFAPG